MTYHKIYLFLLFIILFIVTLFKLYPKYRVYKWRKLWQIKEHQQVFNQLYQSVNSFALSKKARENQPDAVEYTYGEICFESFIALLALCRPTPNTVFYDLGSGVGKAVIAAAMVFNCQKCLGIELFTELVDTANSQQAKLLQLNDYQDKAKTISFVQHDFLLTSLDEATILLINSSCFFGDYWQSIIDYLAKLKSGTIVISLSKPIQHEKFSLIKRCYLQVSWGIIKAFIQKIK